MCVTGPDLRCCCFRDHSDCRWVKLADFGEVLTHAWSRAGGVHTFIAICDGLGVFIPLKGDILMSLFLQTFSPEKFLSVEHHTSFPSLA